MLTTRYKNQFIHSYCAKDNCQVLLVDGTLIQAISLHAAKCIITRAISSNSIGRNIYDREN